MNIFLISFKSCCYCSVNSVFLSEYAKVNAEELINKSVEIDSGSCGSCFFAFAAFFAFVTFSNCFRCISIRSTCAFCCCVVLLCCESVEVKTSKSTCKSCKCLIGKETADCTTDYFAK